MRYKVAAFYKFVRLEDFKDIRKPLLETCRNLELSGTILLRVRVSTVLLQGVMLH